MSGSKVVLTVDSSLLSSVRYSSDRTLELEFQNGTIYRYFAVPQAVFEQLMTAQSKGAYFNHNVRNRFRYQRLG